MKNYLLGIRTTKVDIQTLCLFLYYKNSGLDVVLVVDELQKEVECGALPKVSINKQSLSVLNLYFEHDKLGWLCGDFGLYLMAQQYPNYKGYWFVEDDALIASDNLSVYLGQPLLKNLDFCAKSFWNAHNGWPWKESAEQYFKIPIAKKCSFGVIYVSKLFILDAFKKRIEYIQFFQENNISNFLNDESFIANLSKNYNTERLENLYGTSDLENFHFTTSNRLYSFEPILNQVKQGFYHPIVITSNSQDYYNRLTYILKRQKRLGRQYKNQILSRVTENLNSIQRVFTPRVLVCILYSGNDNIHLLGATIKKRWADYIIVNLTPNKLKVESIPVYQAKAFEDVLSSIEKDYQNHDGMWIMTDKCRIDLDSKQSLVKHLEIPERQKCFFGTICIENKKQESALIYYINFDYYKKYGFNPDEAKDLQPFYTTPFLSLLE